MNFKILSFVVLATAINAATGMTGTIDPMDSMRTLLDARRTCSELRRENQALQTQVSSVNGLTAGSDIAYILSDLSGRAPGTYLAYAKTQVITKLNAYLNYLLPTNTQLLDNSIIVGAAMPSSPATRDKDDFLTALTNAINQANSPAGGGAASVNLKAINDFQAQTLFNIETQIRMFMSSILLTDSVFLSTNVALPAMGIATAPVYMAGGQMYTPLNNTRDAFTTALIRTVIDQA